MTYINVSEGIDRTYHLVKTFETKGHDMTGKWRTLHEKELNELYSPNNSRVTKSRTMRWAGHVARTEEKRQAYRVLWKT